MVELGESLIGLGVAILKVVIAFTVGIGAITLGFRIFGKSTKNLDELAEIRRGNLAVGIVIAAVFLAYTNVIGSGLDQVTDGVLTPGYTVMTRVIYFVGGLLNLAIAVTVASLTIRYALLAFERIAKELNHWEELKRANLAVGLMIAGVIFGLSQVTSRGVNEIGAGISGVLVALLGG